MASADYLGPDIVSGDPSPQEPLRVCLVAWGMQSLLDRSLPPRFGGAELQVWLLATELASVCGVEVHLVAQIPENANPPAGVCLHPFPATTVTSGPGIFAALSRHVLRLLPRLTRYMMAYRWARVLRRTKCDWCVTTVAGLLPDLVNAKTIAHKRLAFWLSTDAHVDGSLLDRDPVMKRRYLRARRRVDLTLAQHRGQQEGLQALGIGSLIVPNGFRLGDDTGSASREFVLWVASCQRLKQPELFLELARRLPDMSFTMIMTPRDPAYFAEVRESARSVGNLILLDGVPDVRPYYDHAIVLVNLSVFEGLPNTFLEAFMSSTPVISLNVDPEDILAAGAGVACGGDFERVVREVERLGSDAEVRASMGGYARVYVEANHRIEDVAARLKRALLDA